MSAYKHGPEPVTHVRLPVKKYEALLNVMEHARSCVEERKVNDPLLIDAIEKWDAIQNGGE